MTFDNNQLVKIFKITVKRKMHKKGLKMEGKMNFVQLHLDVERQYQNGQVFSVKYYMDAQVHLDQYYLGEKVYFCKQVYLNEQVCFYKHDLGEQVTQIKIT